MLEPSQELLLELIGQELLLDLWSVLRDLDPSILGCLGSGRSGCLIFFRFKAWTIGQASGACDHVDVNMPVHALAPGVKSLHDGRRTVEVVFGDSLDGPQARSEEGIVE